MQSRFQWFVRICAGGKFGTRVAATVVAVLAVAVPANAGECEELATLEIPGVSITMAAAIRPGGFKPAGFTEALQIPGFCRVVAVATPTSDSVIHLEVWIPPAERWNRRFEGVGNGGYTGAIQYAEMAEALKRGFATASTDTGHTGGDLTFARSHPEKIIDWAYRSIHVMTDSAKLIIRNYAGAFPSYSYFSGCSTGGAQALSEVQRYPADYDGVIAGDPGNNRVHLNVGFLWAFAATHDAAGKPILPSSKLPLINSAAVAACDDIDAVKDGIISDPQACQFDPAQLLCKGAEDDQCLTPAQIAAVKKVYAGPRNPRTGEQIIPGYSVGSESAAGDLWAHGWDRYITGPQEPMRLEFWKYWVFNNPGWDWRTFDYDHDVAYADEKVKAVNATETDLRAFRDRGGKILMYSGWADSIGPPMDAVDYYRRVQAAMGGRQQTESFFRLFMVPGMAHCGYGPGPNIFGGYGPSATVAISIDPEHDLLSALTEWVEKGSAAESIIAAHVTGGALDRTRPICAYPKVARWSGNGAIDDAKNFTCQEQTQGREQVRPMAKE